MKRAVVALVLATAASACGGTSNSPVSPPTSTSTRRSTRPTPTATSRSRRTCASTRTARPTSPAIPNPRHGIAILDALLSTVKRPPRLPADADRVLPVHGHRPRPHRHRRHRAGLRRARRAPRHRSELARAPAPRIRSSRRRSPDRQRTPRRTSSRSRRAPASCCARTPSTRTSSAARSRPASLPPDDFATLAAGQQPLAIRGQAAATIYAPLWPALQTAGIPATDVIVATVFTTGDEVARVRARSEAIRAQYHPAITGLHARQRRHLRRLLPPRRHRSRCRSSRPARSRSTPAACSSSTPTTSRCSRATMTIPVRSRCPSRRCRPPAGRSTSSSTARAASRARLVDIGPVARRRATTRRPVKGPGYVVAQARHRRGVRRAAAQPGAAPRRDRLRVPQHQQPRRVPVHVPAGRVRAAAVPRRAARRCRSTRRPSPRAPASPRPPARCTTSTRPSSSPAASRWAACTRTWSARSSRASARSCRPAPAGSGT